MSKHIITPSTCWPKVAEQVNAWLEKNFGPNPEYNDAMQKVIDQWGLPWFRAGAVVTNTEGKILLIHEGRVQIKKIKDPTLKKYYLEVEHRKPSEWVDGDGGWNLPAGRLKPGESFEDGVMREVREESDYDIELKSVIDIREGNDPGNLYIMPVYLAKSLGGPVDLSTSEVLEIGWFTPAGIYALNQAHVLRSPEFVMNALDAYTLGG